jgi:hypothetical protein
MTEVFFILKMPESNTGNIREGQGGQGKHHKETP